jgi:uncharacterized protein YjiK
MTQITYVDRHKVRRKGGKIKELSGLCIDEHGHIWVVSDRESAFFELDASLKVARELKVDLIVLYVIAAGPGVIGVASERGVFATYDTDTGQATGERWNLTDWIVGDPKKKGLEGACWKEGSWVVVTEKPGRLLSLKGDQIELLADVGDIEGWPPEEDCSGIHWDPKRKVFWICSHEGAKLYLFDPECRHIVEQLPLTYKAKKKKIEQAEGVAIDGDRLLIACDRRSALYEFRID